ncbi:sulfate transporter CysZ [Solemya velesiana gill symbiont]|uniref:Sulfate transporter CysZ n=1 Tax=Solemya velesiana gill symbiont TaxID=1918948 RepID=A0A1T2KSX0_9GAMM|nr:sulfate transporter CysZ [Solemya velesiana gill symbiont]OOZ35891.1 sulfate transporter [Solemya velesiana gill symbiont]
MNNNPIAGFNFLLEGLKLLLKPGLKRYLIVPLITNILIFTLIGWIGYTQFEAIQDWMLPESSWLNYLRWILWPLFALAALLITFYTFTVVANLIAAPFNSILAERVELLLTGQKANDGNGSLFAAIGPAILSELRKLGYFLLRAIPLLILFVIPGINVIAPFLWLLFSAWFLALEYADYPMGNHGLSFPVQHKRMKKLRLTALGFGGGITLFMMIPLLNLAIMPAAVAGATVMWCKKRDVLGEESE